MSKSPEQSFAASNTELDQNFAEISATFGAAVDDPYPLYRTLRETEPVMKGDILKRFGVPSQADFSNSGKLVYTLFRYADIRDVLRDPATFTSSFTSKGLGSLLGDFMLTAMDGEAHKNLRELLAPCFSPTVLKIWREQLIEPAIEQEFIEPLRSHRRAELMADIGLPCPIRAVYAIMGFPNQRDAVEQFAAWGLRILAAPSGADAYAAARKAVNDLHTHVMAIVRQRRASGSDGNDLIAQLLRARHADKQLDDDKITQFIVQLIPAAAETTTRTLGNVMVLLLQRPELLTRIKNDRKLLPRAIDEAVRFETVAAYLAREVARDVEIRGISIPKGAMLSLALGSGNRDETHFTDGEIFNIDRPPKPTLGFGAGPHTCLGLQVAKAEIEATVNALLDHMPNLRFDPDYPPPKIRGVRLRGPDSIYVRWDK